MNEEEKLEMDYPGKGKGREEEHEINPAEWTVYEALDVYCQEMNRRGKVNGAFK
jgi:hypothetical protein